MEQNYTIKQVSKACRTCLAEINDSSYAYQLFSDHLFATRQKFKDLFPEMNLFLTPSPVICGACYNVIETAYNFKMKCLEIEKLIHIFVEKHAGSVVDLTEINQCSVRCEENYPDDSENTSNMDANVNALEKPSVINETIRELHRDEHNSEAHHEYVDINHLLVKSSQDVPQTNNVIVLDSSSDEDETSDFYKKTPYSCEICPYRTAYKYNLVSHVNRHAQEAKLQKNIEREYKTNT